MAQRLREVNIHVVLDNSSNTVPRKIKQFHKMFIPVMLIVGDNEQKLRCVSVRGKAGQGHDMIPIDQLVNWVEQKRVWTDQGVRKLFPLIADKKKVV